MVPAWHLALARPHVLRGGSRDNQVSQRGINHVAAAFANAPLASSGSRRKQVDGGHRALLGPLHQDRLGPATSAVVETTAVKQDGRTRHAPMQGAVVCWPRPGGSGVQPQLASGATHAAHSARTQRDATHARSATHTARRTQRDERSATHATAAQPDAADAGLSALPGGRGSQSPPQRGLLQAAADRSRRTAPRPRPGGSGMQPQVATAAQPDAADAGLGALPGGRGSQSPPQRGLLQAAADRSRCAAQRPRPGGSGLQPQVATAAQPDAADAGPGALPG